MKVDIAEAARYMGHNSALDAQMTALIETGIRQLELCITPRHVSLELPVFIDGDSVSLGGLEIKSCGLARHIGACSEAIIFAATLGAETDRFMTQRGKVDSAEALCLQAVAAAMIEACCDEAEAQFLGQARERGLFLRPRFSPGYGDFDIKHQTDILRMLQAGKRIGLNETAAHMLTPLKSVTAVIGLCGGEAEFSARKCCGCKKQDCEFRRN